MQMASTLAVAAVAGVAFAGIAAGLGAVVLLLLPLMDTGAAGRDGRWGSRRPRLLILAGGRMWTVDGGAPVDKSLLLVAVAGKVDRRRVCGCEDQEIGSSAGSPVGLRRSKGKLQAEGYGIFGGQLVAGPGGTQQGNTHMEAVRVEQMASAQDET